MADSPGNGSYADDGSFNNGNGHEIDNFANPLDILNSISGPPKRGRGRPRIHPKPDPNQPKRPRGRPPGAKNASPRGSQNGNGVRRGRGGFGATATAMPMQSLDVPSFASAPSTTGLELWREWGFEAFPADRTVIAIAPIPGPDVQASLTVYFEVWNLVRFHSERGGAEEAGRLEDLVAEYLPRSFAWVRDSLRWVEFLLSNPRWTVEKMREFLALPKGQRLSAYLASNPTANPNVTFNVCLQKFLEAQMTSLTDQQILRWVDMATVSKAGAGPFLPWSKHWLLASLRLSGRARVIAEMGEKYAEVRRLRATGSDTLPWPNKDHIAEAKEDMSGELADLATAAVAAGDYPKAEETEDLVKRGGKIAGLEAPPLKMPRVEAAVVPKAAPQTHFQLAGTHVVELMELAESTGLSFLSQDGEFRLETQGDTELRRICLKDAGDRVEVRLVGESERRLEWAKGGWEQLRYAVLGLVQEHLLSS